MGDKEDKKDETPMVAEDSPVSQTLADEIDAGVELAMVEVENERKSDDDADADKADDKADDKEDLSPKEDQVGDDKSGDKVPDTGDKKEGDKEEGTDGDDVPDKDAISDELLDRAVRAGLKSADAKRYPDAAMLAHVCERLEELNKEDGDKTVADKVDNEEDPLAAIPDLDPDVYDEKIVEMVKAIKGIVGQQQETIKGLQVAGKGSMFESKAAGLGEAFKTALKEAPEKRESLKEKFEVLSAGYKAAGKDVDPDSVFNEAVTLTMGDVAAKSAESVKAEALKKRAKQQMSRPGGVKATPTTDAFEDVAAEVDRKYFPEK